MVEITGAEQIKLAHMLAQRGALHLETKGLTRRGRSVYSIVRQEYGFRGNKIKVLQQLEDLIEQIGKLPLSHRYTQRAEGQ